MMHQTTRFFLATEPQVSGFGWFDQYHISSTLLKSFFFQISLFLLTNLFYQVSIPFPFSKRVLGHGLYTSPKTQLKEGEQEQQVDKSRE